MLTGSLVVPHCATARWPCLVLNVCQYGLVWPYIVPRLPCVVLYFAERIQCGLACCWDCHDYSQRVQCGFILSIVLPGSYIWSFIVLRLSAQWKTTSWFGPSFCRCAENVLHVWRFIVQRGPIKMMIDDTEEGLSLVLQIVLRGSWVVHYVGLNDFDRVHWYY